MSAIDPIVVATPLVSESRTDGVPQSRSECSSSDSESVSECIPFPRSELELNVVARFQKVASLLPDNIALRGNGRTWTYQELWCLTDTIAREIGKSTSPGTGCVSYLVDHSPEMVIAALSILKAGKAYLCIHPSLPAAAKQEILVDAAPDLLLHSQKYGDVARFLSKQIPDLSIQPFELRASVGEPAHDGDEPAHKTVELPQGDELGWLVAPADDGACRTVEIDASSPAFICYTSGSTGKPRGIVKSHRAVLHRAYLSATHDHVRPSDRLSLLTYASFASSESDLFGALLNGATIEMFDVVENGLTQLGKWIDDNQVTVLHPPVVLFRRYLSTLVGDNNHPSVRLVALAGESVLPNDIERWRRTFSKNCRVAHRFSSTEAGNIAVAYLHSVGTKDSQPTAVSDKFLAIVDENKQELPPGNQGELVVRSRFLSSGYWRRPEETERNFVASDAPDQKSFYTGDLGCLSAGGEFTFLGRKDGQVKIRGYRVEIREIENALLDISEVSEVAVIAESSRDEQILLAFVVVKPGAEFDSSKFQISLESKLPPWKVPSSFHSLDSLPLTLTGKPDRQKLRALYQALPTVTAQVDCDSDTTVTRLIGIWQTFFPHAKIGPQDNFQALGGHSIMSLTLVSRVTEKFNVTLPLNAAYQYSTVTEMAAAIDNLLERSAVMGSQTLRQVTPSTSFYPPLYIIPGGRGLGIEEIASGAFIEHLKDEVTAYVLAAHNADGKTAGHENVVDIAAEFLSEIRKVQPRGPYLILGGCIGGAVAYELCRQIEAIGEKAHLAMIEGNYITSVRWMREALQRFSGSRYVREFPRRIPRRLGRVLKRVARAPWNSKGPLLAGSAKRIADEVNATFYIRSEGFFITPQERFHLQYRKAISRYRPGTFSGNARLLLSSQYAKRPFVKEWQKVMHGRLDVEVSASTHAEILTSSAEESASFVRRFYRELVAKNPELLRTE